MSLSRPSAHPFVGVGVLVCVGLPVGFADDLSAQGTTTALESLEFRTLEFREPEVEQHRLEPGVEVFFLEDHSLPLVSVFARFRGGTAIRWNSTGAGLAAGRWFTPS